MKTLMIASFTLAAGLFLANCNIAGGAYPEKNGRIYLENHGYAEDLISRVVDGKKLRASEVQELQARRSSDVGYLVARNPHLSHEQIAVSMASKDDFIRSGAANNTNLSASQIEILTGDKSHTVYSALAGNTALTDQQLLRIRDKSNPGGLWFAVNPNCPKVIRKTIVHSGDSLAKDWLKITDERKKEGYYKQDRAGRWSNRHISQ